jgi:F-type H+-transporting ATPase subunit epsilon
LKLKITTPATVLVDADNVISVRAEDESGAFGILDHHTDLLTYLTISIVSWATIAGQRRYCAVRKGVLSVTGGDQILIATREGVLSDNLEDLEHIVLAQFRNAVASEKQARIESIKLQTRVIRQIIQYLRPARQIDLGGDGS